MHNQPSGPAHAHRPCILHLPPFPCCRASRPRWPWAGCTAGEWTGRGMRMALMRTQVPWARACIRPAAKPTHHHHWQQPRQCPPSLAHAPHIHTHTHNPTRPRSFRRDDVPGSGCVVLLLRTPMPDDPVVTAALAMNRNALHRSRKRVGPGGLGPVGSPLPLPAAGAGGGAAAGAAAAGRTPGGVVGPLGLPLNLSLPGLFGAGGAVSAAGVAAAAAAAVAAAAAAGAGQTAAAGGAGAGAAAGGANTAAAGAVAGAGRGNPAKRARRGSGGWRSGRGTEALMSLLQVRFDGWGGPCFSAMHARPKLPGSPLPGWLAFQLACSSTCSPAHCN